MGEEFKELEIKAVEDLHLSPCDIYLLMPSGKRLIISNSGNLINLEIIQKYAQNSQVKILVKACDYQKIIQARLNRKVEVMKQKLTNKQWVNRLSRFDNELNSIAMVRAMMNTFGMSELALTLVEETMESTLFSFEKIPSLKTILADICGRGDFFVQKALMINYLAVYALSKGPWNNESTRSKISMAAFVHDFHTKDVESIKNKYVEVGASVDLKMNYEKFMLHPESEYKHLQSLGTIPDDVSKIVRLHHVDLDGTGFPITEVSQLGPLSQTFNLAHNFSVHLIKNGYSKMNYSGYYYDISGRILSKYKESLDPFSYLL